MFHLLFMIVFFLLFLARALPILVSDLIKTLNLYCCYCLLKSNYFISVIDSSTVMAIFIHITGFSGAKEL